MDFIPAGRAAADRGGRHVVVIGAGIAGLGAALALSRSGYRVTVLERDATPFPPTPDAAFEWDRRGAPQVRHSHALLARLRNLLRDRYPDVLEALHRAGVTDIRFTDLLPPEIQDRSPHPGDEDLVALAGRRTTFEWVLRRAVLDSDLVTLRDGAAVEALEAIASEDGGPQLVTGVRVTDLRSGGPVERVAADVVVAALGRRSAVPRWLAELDVEVNSVEEDTGIVYLSRFYRLRDGVAPTDQAGPIAGDLGYLKYGVFLGDNRTHSVTLAVRTDDAELRARLLDPIAFDTAASELAATAEWVDPDRVIAIDEVHVMGGLVNRIVDYTDEDGNPLVLGFHAIGDSHTCTNPLYGRGCALGLVQANLVADALAEHPDDPLARGRAYEEACEREIRPWYRAAVHQDRLARAEASRQAHIDNSGDGAATESTGPEGSGPSDEAGFLREVMRDGLLPAVRTDPIVFRAFLRAFNLLDAPDAMLGNADVMGRILQAFQDRHNRAPEPEAGPPRDRMLEVLGPYSGQESELRSRFV